MARRDRARYSVKDRSHSSAIGCTWGKVSLRLLGGFVKEVLDPVKVGELEPWL